LIRRRAARATLASRIPTTSEENGIVKVFQQKSDTGQRVGWRILMAGQVIAGGGVVSPTGTKCAH
jgi:hypothetical protein